MSSKFKGIIEAARGQPSGDSEEMPSAQARVRRGGRSVRSQAAPPAEPAAPPVQRRRGRPAGGKRNDPDYEQVTAYVRRDIHRRVKIALLQEDQKLEFSELVDDLLAQWLRTRS